MPTAIISSEFLADLLRQHQSNGVTHDVPIPSPSPKPNEFPMSAPEFLSAFLVPEEQAILRLLYKAPASSKAIATTVGPADKEGYPAGNLKFTLSRLTKAGLISKADDGYVLTDYMREKGKSLGFFVD